MISGATISDLLAALEGAKERVLEYVDDPEERDEVREYWDLRCRLVADLEADRELMRAYGKARARRDAASTHDELVDSFVACDHALARLDERVHELAEER